MPFLVLPAQEVEVHSLVVGMRKPANIEVFGVEVHTIAEAFGEQPRHLPLRDHVELLILARRVEDEYLLRAVGVLRARERGEDARREGHCQQRLTPNATSHGQHAPATSEPGLDGNPEEARRQDGIGPRPRCARDERVVIGEARARVQRVVDVERNHRARPPVPQNLGRANVELVDSISGHRAGRHQIHRHVRRVPGQITSERRRHGRVRHGVIGRQHRSGLALERRGQLNADGRPARRRPVP